MRYTLPTLALLAVLAPAALAQELAAQPQGRHGIAMGTWTEPTSYQDGQMQGLLRRADGTLVYGITANVAGFGRDRYGKLFGQLVSLDDGPMSGPAISVAGMWMEAGEDHGVFDALLVLDGIHTLVPRLVVGSIQGEFGVMRGGGPELKISYARSGDFAPTKRERQRIHGRAADVVLDQDQEAAAQYLRQDDLVGRSLNAGKSSHRSADVAIDAGQEAATQYLRQDDQVGRALNAGKSSHRSADVAIDAGQEAAAQYLRQDDLVGRFLNKDTGPSAADVATGTSRGQVILCPYERGTKVRPADVSGEPMAADTSLEIEKVVPQGLPADLARLGGGRAADLAPKTSSRPVDVATRGSDGGVEKAQSLGARPFKLPAPHRIDADQTLPLTKTSIFVAVWQF